MVSEFKPRQRAAKGTCRVKLHNGNWAILLPKALFDGQLKRIYTGLEATEKNRPLVESRMRLIQNDIDLGTFDYTLDRYQPQYKQKSYLEAVADLKPKISMQYLWQKFLDYQKNIWRESTYFHVIKCISPLIKQLPTDPYKSLDVRDSLLEKTTEGMAKRTLKLISQCFKWGLKHKLVKGNNPYTDMAKELKQPYERDGYNPRAFNALEKQSILEAFKNHHGNQNDHGGKCGGYSYSHYYPFVAFLLLTGCRPSEAIGLTWGKIDKAYRWIEFSGGTVQRNSRLFETNSSKNGKTRKFPINEALRDLLTEHYKHQSDQELVFPAPRGSKIRYNNFCRRAWDVLVDPIAPNTTPYNCRDTFESEQVLKGISPEIVGKWCDSSPEQIRRAYLDSSIMNILPY